MNETTFKGYKCKPELVNSCGEHRLNLHFPNVSRRDTAFELHHILEGALSRHDIIDHGFANMPASKAGYDGGTVITMIVNPEALALGLMNMIRMVT